MLCWLQIVENHNSSSFIETKNYLKLLNYSLHWTWNVLCIVFWRDRRSSSSLSHCKIYSGIFCNIWSITIRITRSWLLLEFESLNLNFLGQVLALNLVKKLAKFCILLHAVRKLQWHIEAFSLLICISRKMFILQQYVYKINIYWILVTLSAMLNVFGHLKLKVS